tara:strand:+ start:902 stop:1159 length:258 start_codon:yes stop_codon:yes gene_type:complete
MQESDMGSQVFYNVGDTIGARLGGDVVEAVVTEVHEDLSAVSVLEGRGCIARVDGFPYCFRVKDILWSDSASIRAKLKEWGVEHA